MAALVLSGWTAAVQVTSAGDAVPSEASGVDDLRALYRSAGGHRSTRVGRLAVRLLQDGAARQVSLDHRFRSGDMFRFEVSSNQAGWLYVLHRSPVGDPQLLWPRLGGDAPHGHLDDNRVRAGETSLIPPVPDVFQFNDEVGNEYFYLVIRPERQAPELFALTLPEPDLSPHGPAPRPAAPAQQEAPRVATSPGPAERQKIVQFSVRSAGGGHAPVRGVVLVPGEQDTDPNAYFAPEPGDGTGNVVFEFRLQHED